MKIMPLNVIPTAPSSKRGKSTNVSTSNYKALKTDKIK